MPMSPPRPRRQAAPGSQQPAAPPPRRPERAATYRVQLNAGFTFDDAAAITGYLAALGVSHLYCSPILQAAAGTYVVVELSLIHI